MNPFPINYNFISKVTGATSSSVKNSVPRVSTPIPISEEPSYDNKHPLDKTHRGSSWVPLTRRPTMPKSGPLGPQTFDREYISQSGWSGADSSATTQFATATAQAREGGMSATDALRYDGADNDVSLNKFLSRPVKIREFTWKEGDALREYGVYPWKEFLRTPEIARKIANYAWISGTMNIQVLVNGTQFHYGKALLSWRPLTRSGTELIRAPGNANFIDNVRFSQRLSLLIDPTECEAGTMELPFVWHKNYLDLNFDTELENIGELILSSYNELQNAQTGSTTPKDVNITVMAYLTDCTLTGATDFVYTSQAKDEYDQGNAGLISTPASAVAKAAGALSKIPMIAPYATATQLGANAVASIAKHYGYSTPNNLEPRHEYKAKPMGELANCIGTSTVDKLSVDPKQELSIDPRISGYEPKEDEMSLLSLVQRESYIGRLAWGFGDTTEKELWRSNVTPVQFQSENISGVGITYHMTPMCAVSQMFEYWRGSMEYRFEIAASKFHKGRLRLVYEPYDQATVFNDYPSWAGPYTRVIDLSEQRSFSLKIGMNQNLPFLQTETPTGTLFGNTSPDDDSFPTLSSFDTLYGKHNGILRLYVLNQLTAPEEVGPAVQINVFARMCDDAEFGAPISNYGKYTSLTNASYTPAVTVFEEEQDERLFTSQSTPAVPEQDPTETTDEIVVEDIVPTQKIDSTMLLHFGESITSLRTLLKRYTFHCTLKSRADGSPGGPTEIRMTVPDFPFYSGIDPTMTPGFDEPNPKTTLLNFVTPFFAARRGGIRWKHIYNEMPRTTAGSDPLSGVSIATHHGMFMATRVPQVTSVNSRVGSKKLISAGQEIDTQLDVDRMLDSYNGQAATPIEVNPVLEIELPYYSNKRFAFGTTNRTNESQGQIGRHVHFLQYNQNLTDDVNDSYVRSYCAAGEDFSLSAFICVPPMIITP